jgi:hypothetical protein
VKERAGPLCRGRVPSAGEEELARPVRRQWQSSCYPPYRLSSPHDHRIRQGPARTSFEIAVPEHCTRHRIGYPKGPRADRSPDRRRSRRKRSWWLPASPRWGWRPSSDRSSRGTSLRPRKSSDVSDHVEPSCGQCHSYRSRRGRKRLAPAEVSLASVNVLAMRGKGQPKETGGMSGKT